MTKYGILHIPTGNMVAYQFCNDARVYETFKEEANSWLVNSSIPKEEVQSTSLYVFFISESYADRSMSHLLGPNILVSENPLFLRKVLMTRDFREQTAMDIFRYTSDTYDEFEKRLLENSLQVPLRSEFSIVPVRNDLLDIETVYLALPKPWQSDEIFAEILDE